MNLIRGRHPLARRASPSGTGQPQASQLQSHRPHPARRPGRGGFAGRFIQGVAAAATVAGRPELAHPCHRELPAAPNDRAPAAAAHRPAVHPLPAANPAGFWVSRTAAKTARRPWCLSCCQDLDPGSYHTKPFDS